VLRIGQDRPWRRNWWRGRRRRLWLYWFIEIHCIVVLLLLRLLLLLLFLLFLLALLLLLLLLLLVLAIVRLWLLLLLLLLGRRLLDLHAIVIGGLGRRAFRWRRRQEPLEHDARVEREGDRRRPVLGRHDAREATVRLGRVGRDGVARRLLGLDGEGPRLLDRKELVLSLGAVALAGRLEARPVEDEAAVLGVEGHEHLDR